MRESRAERAELPPTVVTMGRGPWSVLLVCAAILLAFPRVHAHDGERTIRQFHHTAWRAKDGAPPEIWAMDQGPDGFLWLGTGSGLYRFDGITFERFRPSPGQRLASIDITAVRVLAANEIWVGYSGRRRLPCADGHVTTFRDTDGIWPGMVVAYRPRTGRRAVGRLPWGSCPFRGRPLAPRRRGLEHSKPADRGVVRGARRHVVAEHRGERVLLAAGRAALRADRCGHRARHVHADAGRTDVDRRRPSWVAPAAELSRRREPKPMAAEGRHADRHPVDRQLRHRPARRHMGYGSREGRHLPLRPASANAPTHSLLSSDVDRFRRADGLTSDRSIPILADREGNIWVGTNAGLNRFRDAAIIADKAGAFAYSVAAMPEATYISDGAWLYRAAPNETARRLAPLCPTRLSTMLFASRDGALWYRNQWFRCIAFEDDKTHAVCHALTAWLTSDISGDRRRRCRNAVGVVRRASASTN